MSKIKARKYIPWFDIKRNKWNVHFSAGDITPYKTKRRFKTEEEARQFVLNIFPDVYDVKIETERKCLHCNQILPIEKFGKNRNVCKSCITIQNTQIKQNRRNNNICRNCNKPTLKNSVYCFDHWFMDVSRRHFKTPKYDKALIDLWEKQNRKCVYTGIELIPADNMSLDHIISRYDNPSLAHDFNNVQWVHKDINTMKSKFSHDNFIKLCRYICQRFN
jgi:hypothetical protein